MSVGSGLRSLHPTAPFARFVWNKMGKLPVWWTRPEDIFMVEWPDIDGRGSLPYNPRMQLELLNCYQVYESKPRVGIDILLLLPAVLCKRPRITDWADYRRGCG